MGSEMCIRDRQAPSGCSEACIRGANPAAVAAVNLVPSLGDDSGFEFVDGFKFKDPLRADYVLPFGDT